jgi:hypothetical protein
VPLLESVVSLSVYTFFEIIRLKFAAAEAEHYTAAVEHGHVPAQKKGLKLCSYNNYPKK